MPVTSSKFSFTEIFSITFMTFGFIFGAGNVIFPPILGFKYGSDSFSAVLGFLSSTSLLSLLALIAFGIMQGNLTKFWTKKYGKGFIAVLYLMLGPILCGPRNGIVSFELGLKPVLLQTHLIDGSSLSLQIALLVFTVVFFTFSLWLSLTPSQLVTTVGKVITPLFLLLIFILSVPLFFTHFPSIAPPNYDHNNSAYISGFLEGYNTLDVTCIPVFGIIVFDTLRRRAIHSSKGIFKSFVLTTFSAPIFTALIYIAFCYIGLSEAGKTTAALSGPQILLAYTQAHFGWFGEVLLGMAVFLACLSTAIGFIVANGEFFHEMFPKISYRKIAISTTIITVFIANIGLTELTHLTQPVLNFFYPILIALIICGLFTPLMKQPKLTNYAVVGVTVIINTLSIVHYHIGSLRQLPLFDNGLGWLLPMACTLILCLFLPDNDLLFDSVAD
nr:branched-chain amino acid transport system II carrier protein [Parashewanella hymeniacidonis]